MSAIRLERPRRRRRFGLLVTWAFSLLAVAWIAHRPPVKVYVPVFEEPDRDTQRAYLHGSLDTLRCLRESEVSEAQQCAADRAEERGYRAPAGRLRSRIAGDPL